MNKKSGFDKTAMIGFVLISLVAAVGILFFCMACFNVDFNDCNRGMMVGFYWFTTALVWLLLMLRGC